MNALIPLAFALILVNRKKLKDDNVYRLSVFSVVGFTCFFLLRFVVDYFTMFPELSEYEGFVMAGVVLACVGLCLSPWFCRSGLVKSGVFLSIFIISIVATFTVEKKITTVVAVAGGYFDSSPELSVPSNEAKRIPYLIKKGGYTVFLTNGWVMKSLDPSGFLDYFELYEGDKKVVELRPTCFHKTALSLPEIVLNIHGSDDVTNMQTTKNGYRVEGAYACLVKSVGGTQDRWHWLYEKGDQGIELDIVFFNDEPTLRGEMLAIINHIEVGELPTPTPVCISPMAWL